MPPVRPPKTDTREYIPRPPNAFILFRRHCCEGQATMDETTLDVEHQHFQNKAKEARKKHQEMYPKYAYGTWLKMKESRFEKKGKRADVEKSDSHPNEFLPRSYGAPEESFPSSKSLPVFEPHIDPEYTFSASEKHYPAPYKPQTPDRNLTRQARRQASRQGRKQASHSSPNPERTKRQSPSPTHPSISFLLSLFQARNKTTPDKMEEDGKNSDGACSTDDRETPDSELQRNDRDTGTSYDASDEASSSTIIHDGNFTNVNGDSYNTWNIHINMDSSILSSLVEDEVLEEEDNMPDPWPMEDFGREYEHPEIIYQTPHPPPTPDIPSPPTPNIPSPSASSWFLPVAYNPCYFWPPPILYTGWSFVIAGWVMTPPISWSWPFYSWA